MYELIPKLLPFLIVDILNPVLFALMIVAVGSRKPVLNSAALLAGHTSAYFASGIVIAIGLEQMATRFANPKPADFFVELLLGILCLWAALASRDGNASKKKEPERELTPLVCFAFGGVVNFIGVPFALPYFAVVDQLLKADLSTESSLLTLAFYNLAYALPFMLVPLMVAVMGDAAKPVLERTSQILIGITDKFMPLLLLLLGSALVADAVKFLVTGQTLW